MTVHDFIKELGGLTAVSKDLGLPLTTVHGWMRNNRIPNWRRPALAELAAKREVDMPARFADVAA